MKGAFEFWLAKVLVDFLIGAGTIFGFFLVAGIYAWWSERRKP